MDTPLIVIRVYFLNCFFKMRDSSIMKVAIIDTGYSGVPEHCTSINGIAINEINGCISIGNDYSDTIGHGTAVTNLLLKKSAFYTPPQFEDTGNY